MAKRMMDDEPQTVNTVAESLFGLLDDDLEFQAPDAADAEPEDEGEEPESPVQPEEDDGEDEASEGEEAADDDDGVEDDGDESEPEDGEESDDTDLYEITVDGETVRVSLDEALKGYQRQAAFTKKTMALAEERKALEAELAQIRDVREKYATSVEKISEALKAKVPEAPKRGDFSSDAEFAAAYAEYSSAKEQHAAWQAEQTRVQQEAQADFQRQKQELLEQESKKLLDAIPEWKADPSKRESEQQAIASFLMNDLGATQEELDAVLDHRFVVLAREAMLYRKMREKGKTVTEKAKTSPKLKPGSKASKKSRKKTGARDRLARTGRLDDAAAAILETLPDDF